jgi:hypothetical protein
MGSSKELLKEYRHRIFGTSVIGPLHTKQGLPCQDACAFDSLHSGFSVIAVADGLGSASKSDIGAQTAVSSAVRAALREFDNPEIDIGRQERTVREAVEAARRALEEKACEMGCALRDLACTLIVTTMTRDCISVAHIGDGAVVAETVDGLKLISVPGESEYANEVVPLTSKSWGDSLRVIPLVENIRCLAVFTDGCQRACLRKTPNGLEPYLGFFGPVFSYAQGCLDLQDAEEDIRSLLLSQKVCSNSEDDKTLVLGVIGRS